MLTKRLNTFLWRLLLPILLVFSVSGAAYAQSPTVQDCLGAIPICSDSITISFNHNGMGNFANEIANVSSCYAPEQRSVWFKFTVQQGGLLRFEIDPLNVNQDHDWTLFDLTSGTCSQLSTWAGASSAMVRSNTWGAWGFNGSTGVSTPNGGTGTCNGPGATNGPKWCQDLSVSAGETYYLHITNWTGTVYGFTIDFSSSTAVLYDQTPPAMDSISSVVNCVSFDSMIVDFDENVVCSSLQTGDFQLSGPSGNHTITSVSGLNCLGGISNSALIYFTPAVTQIGNYELTIQPGAGYVEDACGNLDTLDTIGFYFDGSIETNLTPDHIECWQECDGGVSVNAIGGIAPFDYSWSTGNTTTSISGLCAGTYAITVTDSVGCEILDSVEVTQPDDIVTTLISTQTTSCPGTSACNGAAEVQASGGTPPFNYTWSSSEIGNTPSALCAGMNYVTVSDAYGCLDTLEVEIETPDSIVTTGAGDTLICISNITNVAASAVGGTAPYNYIWHEGPLEGPVISTSQITSVSPDTTTVYTVQVVDDRGCIGDTSEVLIRVRPPLGIDIPQVDTICPYDTIDVQVAGTGGDSIYTYAWETGVFGDKVTISPDLPTWYTLTISDACGTPSYIDSVWIQVGGYSPIDAEIRVEDDSICVGENVYLIASGRGGFKGPEEYVFKWSEANMNGNPIQFVRPTSTKEYTVTISDLCLSEPSVAKRTIYVGEPYAPPFVASPTESCSDSDVIISIGNFMERYSYTWNFGDGEVYANALTDSVFHRYDTPGCYDVTLSTVSDFGCFAQRTESCLIKILNAPTAAFDHSPEAPSSTLSPFVRFEDTSIGARSIVWSMNGDTLSMDSLFIHEFSDTGAYVISLLAISKEGCTDTITKTIFHKLDQTLYIPTSFTPNGDGLNDEFRIAGEGIIMDDFELSIYDRWGTLVFYSKNPEHGWDGKSTADGSFVPAGSYPFVLRYRDLQGEHRAVRDHILIPKIGIDRGLR